VFAEPHTAQYVRDKLAGDAEFTADYPFSTVNTIGELDAERRGPRFNVRLKLDDEQRDAIAVDRQQWRERRAAAEAEGLEPPGAYEPPYVAELRRVFAGELVEPAFSNADTTKQPDRENQAFAQIDVHFQQPVLVAEARERLSRTLPQCLVTPLLGDQLTEAKNLRVEWTTQATTKKWELAGLVQNEIRGAQEKDDAYDGLRDVNGKPVLLSEPFPEAQEIHGRLVNELRNAAIGALILAWALIVLYLRVRFHEYKYGVAAVVALIHDVLVAFGIVVMANHLGLVHAEINLAMIACFLTIIGYSVNDTIVVFDRIRENRMDNARNGVDEPFRALINRSLNQTLGRTVLTTVLTLFVVLAQFAVNWGSESDLESFAFAMIIGMISGVYSTIYIAAPILIWMDKGVPPVVPETPVPAEQVPAIQDA
jgi:preprotein translocase SecF subunit